MTKTVQHTKYKVQKGLGSIEGLTEPCRLLRAAVQASNAPHQANNGAAKIASMPKAATFQNSDRMSGIPAM